MLCFLESGVSTSIIWNSSPWTFIYSPPFTYSTICTHGYLFCTLDYNPIFCFIVLALVVGNFQLAPVSYRTFTHHGMCVVGFLFVCFVFLSTSLLFRTRRYSIILATVLESAISLRRLGSFYLRMVLETKIWAVGMTIATGMLIAFMFFQLSEQGNTCVYTCL